MSRLLLAVFRSRAAAQRARRGVELPNAAAVTRLHDAELDPLLGMDLVATPTQRARERDVLGRFFAAFAAPAAIGLVVDLSGVLGDTAPAATVLLGTLGVALGTLNVLRAPRDGMERAFTTADAELARGAVIVTALVDEHDRERAALALERHGGRTFFAA